MTGCCAVLSLNASLDQSPGVFYAFKAFPTDIMRLVPQAVLTSSHAQIRDRLHIYK